MDKQQSLLIKKYIDLLLRWKVLLIILLLVSLPLGLGIYLRLPKVYQAHSLLSYQQQKINPNKMSPDVEAGIKETVSTLTQIVTSRTNLESIIKNLELYPELIRQLPMEDVVDLMRRQILIEPSREGDIFKITFTGSNPGKVVKVTNALAAKFIEENLKFREERATETSSYTSDELEMAKVVMDRKEAASRDYKLKYYNEMPEQRESNVSRLIALQEQYQEKQNNILELEQTLVMIQEQIASRKKLLALEGSHAAAIDLNLAGQTEEMAGSSAQRLAQLEAALQYLLAKYTEKHPEVKRMRKLIVKLTEEVAADIGSDAGSTADLATVTDHGNRQIDRVILQLEAQLKKNSLSIETITAEKEQLAATITQYEQWVAAAPIREAEWSALTREYGQLKKHYDFLVSQNLQAKSMLNLERRQKGSQFKIEDPARFPEKPIKPDFLKVIGLAVSVALAMGVGCVLCVDFLDSSIRESDEVETFLGVPVVSTIEYIETAAEEKSRKRKLVAGSVLLCLAFAAIAVFFLYAWSRGKIVI